MSSEKQIRSNRCNAQKSTGPKSAAGKAVVRLNAVKHGVLAEAVVIPFMESEEEWEEHRRGILESVAPVGHIETALAERVAELLWRLRRTTRYEREVITDEQEALEEKILGRDFDSTSLEYLRRDWENARATMDLLENFPRLETESEISAIVALPLIEAAAETAEDLDAGELKLPHSNDTIYNVTSLCADDLRWLIMAIAERAGTSPERVLEVASEEVYSAAMKAELYYKMGTKRVGRARRLALLPSFPETDRIIRYETHLDRSLYKALHELQRLQAMRMGCETPLPVAVDVNTT